MKGWIYILHFEEKLSHAEHYIGCTVSLRSRLEDHANGQGSAICRHLFKIGAEWQLAGLYNCPQKTMRLIERKCKDHHRGSHWCTLCNAEPYLPPGSISYDLSLLPFEPTSKALRSKKDYSTTVELATMADCAGIHRIMKQHNDFLGFIPVGGTGGFTLGIAGEKVIVAKRTGVIIGFVIFTKNSEFMTIQQCAVDSLCMMQGVGRQLVEFAATLHSDLKVQCNVRNDLVANNFWSAIGFKHTHTHLHKTSHRPLNHYERDSIKCLTNSSTESPASSRTTEPAKRSRTSRRKSSKKSDS